MIPEHKGRPLGPSVAVGGVAGPERSTTSADMYKYAGGKLGLAGRRSLLVETGCGGEAGLACLKLDVAERRA